MGGKVTREQYYAIKNSLSYTEKEIIDFYELQWALKNYVPTEAEVVEYINSKFEREKKHHRINHKALGYYQTRQNFVKALDRRGIPWRQHTQSELTSQQVAAAITVMNMMDDRPIPVKLDEMGVNPAQYYAWLNDPTFKTMVDNLADKNLAHIRPTAIAEFTKKINQGDWNAIKFWLETTGELNNRDAPQSEKLIVMLIEIIQRHVKDPNTIMAIAQDIKNASQNRTLEVVQPQPAITGEFVEHDSELEAAKKQLGFG